MNWKNLLVPVRDFTPEEARTFLAAHDGGAYQLLDVRQPKEYEEGHLAGAMLIPMKELPARLTELAPDKPVLVYCAVGGRSKAAAQFLAGKDFAEVYNLKGGIKAWQGGQAVGPEEAGLALLSGDEEFEDGLSLAYAMEDGLQRFYGILASQTQDQGQRHLYQRLAGFEDLHKARLREEYRRAHGRELAPSGNRVGTVEGGRPLEELLARAEALVRTRRDIVELAMAIETQAMDLYGRMARRSARPETAGLFVRMADEENQHLAMLAAELDRVL